MQAITREQRAILGKDSTTTKSLVDSAALRGSRVIKMKDSLLHISIRQILACVCLVFSQRKKTTFFQWNYAMAAILGACLNSGTNERCDLNA